jgi:GxxExxY protein
LIHHRDTKGTKKRKRRKRETKIPGRKRMATSADDRVRANELSSLVIGAAIEVHRHLGPGLLESAYQTCLERELTLRRVPFDRQVDLPVEYKGLNLDCAYRMDLVVGGLVVVELKAVEAIAPIFEAQLLTYLRLPGHWLGLLINFCVPVLKDGVRRRVLD